MNVAETNRSGSHLALFSRPTMIGVIIVVFATLSDGDLERPWIGGLLAFGAALLAYSLELTRFGGRSRYAARFFTECSSSNSMGLL